MKKFIKIFILIVLVLSVSACNNGGITDVLESEVPDLTEQLEGAINIYRPPTQNLTRYKYQDEWETVMKDTYGIDIKIHNISPMYQYDITIGTFYIDAIQNDELSGIIEIKQWEIQNMVALKEAGLIYPLDEFLKDNSVYQSLPGAMRNAFIMPDGQTWAIPTSSPFGLYSRKLKKDWVAELGIDVPTNLAELYELTRQFAYDDPNGNDEQDEHGMDIIASRGATMLIDIFLANGCYLSNNAGSSIAYDYVTGAYEDSMIKPEMRSSLEYIKGLHDDGLLVQNDSSDFLESESTGNFMTLSLNTDYRLIDIVDWHEVYTLSDTNVSVMGIRPYKLFVMTTNTPEPEKTINTFVNTFLSDEYGLANGTYGVEGKNYTLEDNVLTCLFDADALDMGKFSEENIGLTHFNFNVLIDEGITLVDPQWTDISIPGAIRETQLYNDFYNEGKLFFDSNFMLGNRDNGIDDQFGKEIYKFLADIDKISIDDFIQNYINTAKAAGWQESLDDLNYKAEKTASYRYD